MMRLRSISVVGAALLATAACSPEAAQDENVAPAPMDEAEPMTDAGDQIDYDSVLAGEHRSAENRARDAYRHPQETLAFFGLEPGMTVVEISPGGGWYTEVLAPAVGADGTLYAAHADPSAGDRAASAVTGFQEKLDASPVYQNTQLVTFSNGQLGGVPADSADMVLTFRNVHNWHMGGNADAAFQSFFTALKPGGILGVVDHRLPEDRDDADMEKSGYMKTSTVTALAEAAGFELVSESEINANPADTSDYEGGVWTLPPTLAGGDEDRERYTQIGESDRMTLKFRKPA